jgi:hypothetical protein
MKSTILEQAQNIVNELPYDLPSKYMFLASFVVYFKSPLKSEAWNRFPKTIERKEKSVRDGLFSTDEEKNPLFWNDSKISARFKTQVRNQIFEELLRVRDSLVRKKLFGQKTSRTLVSIPDFSNPKADPTLFPIEYLRQQVEKGKYVNELTGQPLSWTVVEQVKRNSSTEGSSHAGRLMSGELIKSLILKEIEQIKRYQEACAVCGKKFRQFKTLRDYQTVYFCTLKCLSLWDQ